MTIHNNTREKGFTIVEALVAISILVTAIIGATSAVQTGLSSYILLKDQTVAFYLAQEAFEGVRNIRDQNGLARIDWLTGISENPTDPCWFGEACIVNAVASTIVLTPCPSPGNCPPLRQSSDGFFGYSGVWPETGFTREIVLSQVSPNEISVTVTVDWSKGLITREFKARENLLRWY